MFRYIFGLLISTNVYAVQTAKCPETLQIELQNVQIFSQSFIGEQIMARDWVDIETIEAFRAGELNSFSVTANLVNKYNSTCRYEAGAHPELLYAVFKIEGSDASATLVANITTQNESRYSLHAKPTSKYPVYDFSRATVQIRAHGSVVAYDEPHWPKPVSIGKAMIKPY